MDNYFVSYKGEEYKLKSYIIPEISIISNTTSRENLIAQDNDLYITDADARRWTKIFIPIIYRVCHNLLSITIGRLTKYFLPEAYRETQPIIINSWIIDDKDRYYEVTEGIYNVSSGELHLKLKVQKQYG